jgi:phenylpropionate dioxygenase-like ring-hydroxylating dioxygenase large terminal subunit
MGRQMSETLRVVDNETPAFRRHLSHKVLGEGEDGLFTQSWYPICLASAVSSRFVRGFDFLDGRVVVVRDEAGLAQVLSGYCPHMGADLSAGHMVDGQIRCIFHHWRFGADGRCKATAIGDPAPEAARLFKYPTRERYGLIWAFNGLEPHYELPDMPFPDEDLVFRIRPMGEMPVDPWILCANTPDVQHIKTLHGITIDGEDPHDAVEWTDHSLFYEFSGVHTTGDHVKHRVGIVGTSLYWQSTTFGDRWFGFMAPFSLPRPGASFTYLALCVRKDMGTPEEIDAFLNFVMDLETKVVSEDMHNMQTIHFKPGVLTRSDSSLAKFFRYMRDYPRGHPGGEFIK